MTDGGYQPTNPVTGKPPRGKSRPPSARPETRMTEAEMRDAKVPWPQTRDELADYIDSLTNREHDYGTCVYAMSMAAVAAFQYVAHVLGTTGFQASCADMDILARTRGMKHGFFLRDNEDLLYPQYRDKYDGLDFDSQIEKNAEWLAGEARRRIASRERVHPDVLAHWERLAEFQKVASDD